MALVYCIYPMPFGLLTIGASERGVRRIVYGRHALAGTECPSALTNQAATELQEYFAGRRRWFNTPLDLAGSAFQQEVWAELARIPFGEVRTSAQVAQRIGKPGAYRSVGAAVKRAPVAIMVPDHRVVGGNGQPLGTGERARIARGLLALERRAMGHRP